MKMKKVLAVLMSLCMTAGVVSYGAPVITKSITAQADTIEGSCYSFNEETGELTLKGEIDKRTIRSFSYKQLVTSIFAEEGTVFPENCYEMFSLYENCTAIDLSNVDTSNVSDMSWMFYGCTDLTTLDLSGFDTGNVTDMNNMFSSCRSLTSLDLSSFNTSKVTKMHQMFSNCTNLTSLDLSNFDTSKVTYMNDMFFYCSSLTELDISGFDTSSVTTMGHLFRHCSKLTSLDLSSFDTSNVEYMYGMFCDCIGLTKLDLSGLDTSSIRDINYMFDGCVNLTSLDLSSFDTSKDVSMTVTFRKCDKLKILTLGENFKSIEEGSELTNGDYGWININSPKTVVSGSKKYAIIYNEGKNTYKRLTSKTEAKLTYPTNINIEYSTKYHQVRISWNKVEDADRYGIAVYLAGKWRVQVQNITGTAYTTPKNLTPGKNYRVVVVARVNGNWDTANAIHNAVTVTIP